MLQSGKKSQNFVFKNKEFQLFHWNNGNYAGEIWGYVGLLWLLPGTHFVCFNHSYAVSFLEKNVCRFVVIKFACKSSTNLLLIMYKIWACSVRELIFFWDLPSCFDKQGTCFGDC